MSKSGMTTVVAVAAPQVPQESFSLYAASPQAGFPAPGDDLVEATLNIHDLVVKHPASTFFVRVQGDSMEGAGIFSGDVLVVDRSLEPKQGSIVIAAVDGGMVVKRIAIDAGGLSLVSEHRDYAPIRVSQDNECFVWGVVVGSVRVF